MLELKSIKKAFGDKVVLDGFSYTFDERGLYVIVGDSGVGKTTLLRIICGLDKNFDGEMIGGGHESSSFCFQEYRLIPWLTALDNVLVAAYDKPTDEDVTEAKKMLTRLKITDGDYILLPSSLSGGMKQRVSFVRAILKDAPILLLDEPTKEVDAELAEIMRELIIAESKKRTVIVVTHKSEDIDALGGTVIRISAR